MGVKALARQDTGTNKRDGPITVTTTPPAGDQAQLPGCLRPGPLSLRAVLPNTSAYPSSACSSGSDPHTPPLQEALPRCLSPSQRPSGGRLRNAESWGRRDGAARGLSDLCLCGSLPPIYSTMDTPT